MTLEEFNKERDKRAKNCWDDARGIYAEHVQGQDPTGGQYYSFMIQWLLKEIASSQMMIEKLVEHTKMPPLDAQ